MNLYWSSVWTIPGRCSLKLILIKFFVDNLSRTCNRLKILDLELSSSLCTSSWWCYLPAMFYCIFDIYNTLMSILFYKITNHITNDKSARSTNSGRTMYYHWSRLKYCLMTFLWKSRKSPVISGHECTLELTKWTEASSYWVDTSDKNIRTSSGFSGTSKSGHFRNWYFLVCQNY